MIGPEWWLPVQTEDGKVYIHPSEADGWSIDGPPVYGLAKPVGDYYEVTLQLNVWNA